MKARYALISLLLVAVVTLTYLTIQKSNLAASESEARAKLNRELESARGELERMTQDQNPRIRQRSIELLQECKPDRAVELCPALLEAETDPSAAVSLLGFAGQRKLVPAFPAVLKQFSRTLDMTVRAKAAWVIGEIAPGADEAQRNVARESLEHTLSLRLQKADTQNEKPFEPDPGLMLACIDALGKLKDARSASTLVGLLDSKFSAVIRRAAVRCLNGIAAKEHADAIQAAWKAERDPSLRVDIERLLAKEPIGLVMDRQKGVFVPR
jgi:HEAT repeat protein